MYQGIARVWVKIQMQFSNLGTVITPISWPHNSPFVHLQWIQSIINSMCFKCSLTISSSAKKDQLTPTLLLMFDTICLVWFFYMNVNIAMNEDKLILMIPLTNKHMFIVSERHWWTATTWAGRGSPSDQRLWSALAKKPQIQKTLMSKANQLLEPLVRKC